MLLEIFAILTTLLLITGFAIIIIGMAYTNTTYLFVGIAVIVIAVFHFILGLLAADYMMMYDSAASATTLNVSIGR